MFFSLHRQTFRNNVVVIKVQRALLSAVTTNKQKLIARYTTVPLKLFRIVGSNNKVILREKEKQFSKGSRSYDYTASSDALLHPAPLDDYFIGPNGASLRPAGGQMWEILSTQTGVVKVIEIPEGTHLPPDMVILHEHTDHYSLQTTKSIKPSVFSKNVTEFLSKFEVYPKEVYFERYPFC